MKNLKLTFVIVLAISCQIFAIGLAGGMIAKHYQKPKLVNLHVDVKIKEKPSVQK